MSTELSWFYGPDEEGEAAVCTNLSGEEAKKQLGPDWILVSKVEIHEGCPMMMDHRHLWFRKK